jgi:hypothetical protein
MGAKGCPKKKRPLLVGEMNQPLLKVEVSFYGRSEARWLETLIIRKGNSVVPSKHLRLI